MLIDFSFSNFKSYRDEQHFSMRRPLSAQKHEEKDWGRKDISTIAGIYGGNAAGKSALIDAMRFVTDFIAEGLNPSFGLDEQRRPFMLDPLSRERPSDFLVDFLGTDDKRYLYELSVQSDCVVYESLRMYNGSRTTRIFERERDDAGAYAYRYGRAFAGAKKPYEQMTRPDAPFIAVLYAVNLPVVKPAYEFLCKRIGFYKANLYQCELENLRQELRRGSPTAKALATLMASSDLGISVVQRRDPLDELQRLSQVAGAPGEGGYEDLASGMLTLSNPDLTREDRRKRAKDIAKVPPEPRYEFAFTQMGVDGCEETFDESEESTGTLTVLAFFSLALRLLSRRSVGFVDEIDASLHPTYVQELVALFNDPRTNPHQSQLIFTTHDVSLITRTGADVRVLDQDQIWLVEKSRDGVSSLYPVTSIASRWDENFGRNYMHGVYGAYPRPGFHEAFARVEEELSQTLASTRYTATSFGGDAR
jgi:hypothetical protein